MGHSFVRRVNTRRTVKTLNNVPHVWTVGVGLASWRRFFQLSVLVSFIASVASRQASIHSWGFWWIVWRRWWWSFDGGCSMVPYSMFPKVTNSNDYRRFWAVNLLHALQLLAPLTHKAQWVILHKKWSFSLRVFSINASKSTGNCGFGRIYWRNPSWKTSFSYSVRWIWKKQIC